MQGTGGVTLDYVSADELVTLNDRLAFTFRSMGLKGAELDRAIVGSLHPALRSLEQSRAAQFKRRERIKLVSET